MAYPPSHVHVLSRSGAASPADAPPERVIAGSGRGAGLERLLRRVRAAFMPASGRASPAAAVAYTETELCVILVGRVRLTDERGSSAEFGPGDAFVIASGFRGTWESIGRVTKIYAVLDPEPPP